MTATTTGSTGSEREAPGPSPGGPPPVPVAASSPPGAAATPSASPSGTPPIPPKPLAPTPAAPAPRPPRTGRLRDEGVVRRDSVRALAWWASGTVKVTGDVDVGDGRILGTLSVGGQLFADAFECRGTLEVEGGVKVEGRLTTDGAFRVAGSVRLGEGSFGGTTRIARDVTADGDLEVRGHLAASSVRAGAFRADGAVDVPGAVEAIEVDVLLRRDSRLGALRARSARILRKPPNPVETVLGRSPPSPVDRIEADWVELEGVDVAFVRSPEIILGRDAHVTEVEGTIVRRHASARVGPESRSPPPHGLSR